MPDWLTFSFIADVSSLVSLAISGYAAYAITKVRSQIVNRIRLPDFVQAFEEHGKSLSTLMRTYDDAATRDNVLLEIAKCETKLRLVRGKVGRSVKKSISRLISKMSNYQRAKWWGLSPQNTTRDNAWTIYIMLNALIEELNDALKEQQMGA